MKLLRILCAGAAILIPQLVLAKLPFSNETFGKVEGILDFCAKADPQSAPKYQEQKKALVKDATEKEVALASLSHFFFGGVLHRSEEHTSELQSRENLVCRLLLEKKKL